MTLTKTLAAGVIAGTCVLGVVGEAHAANLTRSWDVVEAQTDQYSKYNGGHAFWLPKMADGGKFVLDGDATFNEFDDGTAELFGSIVSASDANKKWDFNLFFESTTVGTPKKELKNAAYSSGLVDTNTWSYYNYSSTQESLLTASSGDFAGQSISLSDKTGGKHPLQVGYGASGKNVGMGMSTWFKYSGSQSSNNADINVNLIAKKLPSGGNSAGTPEPITMAGSLAALCFGAAFKKKLCKKDN